MKIFINVSNNLTGGSLQVALSFLNESKVVKDIDFVVAVGNSIEKQLSVDEFPDNFVFYNINTKPLLMLSKKLGAIENIEKPDAVFTVFGPAYWRPKTKHVVGFANPFYGRKSSFIDNLPLREKLKLKFKQYVHTYFMNRDADIVVVETQEALDSFKKIFKIKDYRIVSNNCSNYYYEYKDRNKEFRYDTNFTLLTLSNYRNNKNFEIIPKLIRIMREQSIFDISFVITISQDIYKMLGFDKYKEIINIGPQKACECPMVYQGCDAMFLPTYLECFSASYPEAMVMGKPILTSDLGFAHNICKDAAIYFNPDDPCDVLDKILMLKKSKDLQKKLISSGIERVKCFPSPHEKFNMYLSIIKEK